MKIFMAIDIGGTHLRVATYPEDGITPLKIERIPTKHKNESVVDRLCQAIGNQITPGGTLNGIGVAVPGPTNPVAGIVYTMPNVHGYDNLPLSRLLSDRFDVPVALGNDANLAGLGEWHYGAGQGHKHMIYMTISTGIGGGVICDGKLLLGRHGLAGELGHVTILPDGPLCGCGKRGHLEAVSSGTAIANYVREKLAEGVPSSLAGNPSPTAKEIGQAAKAGDALAVEALARAGRFLGLGLANYLQIFNPSIIILGGGVTQSGSLLFGPVRKAMEETAMDEHYLTDLVLTQAKLGDDAGLLGALSLAREF